MSLNNAVNINNIKQGNVAVDGEITVGEGLTNGASATGSCTLSDTSLYTFAYPVAFKEIPKIAIGLATAGMRYEILSNSTTGCSVRGFTYNGTTKTAITFSIIAIGRGVD